MWREQHNHLLPHFLALCVQGLQLGLLIVFCQLKRVCWLARLPARALCAKILCGVFNASDSRVHHPSECNNTVQPVDGSRGNLLFLIYTIRALAYFCSSLYNMLLQCGVVGVCCCSLGLWDSAMLSYPDVMPRIRIHAATLHSGSFPLNIYKSGYENRQL